MAHEWERDSLLPQHLAKLLVGEWVLVDVDAGHEHVAIGDVV